MCVCFFWASISLFIKKPKGLLVSVFPPSHSSYKVQMRLMMALWNCWVMHIIKGVAPLEIAAGLHLISCVTLATTFPFSIILFPHLKLQRIGPIDSFSAQTKIFKLVNKNWFSAHCRLNALLGKSTPRNNQRFKRKRKTVYELAIIREKHGKMWKPDFTRKIIWGNKKLS